MSNNRMWLINAATGQRVLVARHLAVEWRAESGIEDKLDRAFIDEVVGSTAWRVEYEDGPTADVTTESRDERQIAVLAWARAAFSDEQATSLPQRGLRLLEEAIELFQACGGSEDIAHRLVGFVFGRPPGEVGRELGGVGVTVLALAAAAGLSADAEELREIDRVTSRPVEEFARRNQAKNEARVRLVDGFVDETRGER